MYSKTNEKINQITHDTLVVGIDIAKSTHYAAVSNERGLILCNSFSFKQTRLGFLHLQQRLEQLMVKHEKTHMIVGFEPTGHYWVNLALFLTKIGIPYVFVNPLHVKQTKELGDNLQSKNDKKDARVISRMLGHGYYSIPREMTSSDQELRAGASYRVHLQKKIGINKNRIQRWLDMHFPEFSTIFKNVLIHAQAILEEAPLPEDYLSSDPETLYNTLRARGIKSLPKKNIAALFEAAQTSIGVSHSPKFARIEILDLIQELRLLQAQLKEVNQQLIEVAKEYPDFHILKKVDGISDVTIALVLAETGSLMLYDHPKQVIKLAGLALATHSSGELKGRNRLSKRGRKNLRSILYKAALPLMHNNPAFKQVYEYYRNRPVNPLTGKESLVLLCRKMLQVFHGLVHNGFAFDQEKMIRDIPQLSSPSQAA